MRTRKAGGFTLIELLIVIAIIGILAAVLIPNLLQARTRGVLTAGTNYARETLVALESMQSSNSNVDYLRTVATQNFVTGSARAATVTLFATNAGGSETFTVSDYLRAPQQGITEVDFYPPAIAGGTNALIEVEQVIGGQTWCTELNTTTNELRQDLEACNGIVGPIP